MKEITIVEKDVSKVLLMKNSLGGMEIIILYKNDTASTLTASTKILSDLSKTSLTIINVEDLQ